MYLLLIDHNFISSDELQDMMDRAPAGTDIVTCFATDTLLKTADKLNPEIIIVDFEMIKGDVNELFATLREKSKSAHILALIEPEFYDRLDTVLEAGGIDDYMVKPIRKEDFMARINLAARRKGLLDKGPGEAELFAEPDSAGPEEESLDSESVIEEGFEGDLLTGFEDEEAEAETGLEEPAGEEEIPGEKDFAVESGFFGQTYRSPYEEDQEELDLSSTVEKDEEEESPDDLAEMLPEESEQELQLEPDSEPGEPEVPADLSMDDLDFEEGDLEPPEELPSSPDEDEGFTLFDETPTETAGEAEKKVEGEEDLSGEDSFENLFAGEPKPKEDSIKSFEETIGEEPAGKEPAGEPEWSFTDLESHEPGPEQDRPAGEEDLTAPREAPHEGPPPPPPPEPGTPPTPPAESEPTPPGDSPFDELFDDQPKTQKKSFTEEPPPPPPEPPSDDDDFWAKGAEQSREKQESAPPSSLPGESADDFLKRGEPEDDPATRYFFDRETAYEQWEEDSTKRGRGRKKKKYRSRSFLSTIGGIFFVLLLLLMAVLAVFLIQSRITGGAPQVFGYQMYIVLSGSMEPELDTGSLVFVREADPQEIAVGDVITFRSPDDPEGLTTHRVVGIHENARLRFTTRGDANEVNDPRPVGEENLVGRVSGSLPYVGYLLNFVQTREGLILLIFVPGVLIIAFEMRKIFVYLRDKKKGSFETGA